MEQNKIDHLAILVHPFYDLVNTALERYLGSSLESLDNVIYNIKSTEDLLALEKKIMDFIKTDKAIQVQYKKSLAEYGKKGLQHSKDPNTLFVLFKSYNPINVNKKIQLNSNYRLPRDELIILNKKYEKAELIFESVYNKLLSRFETFLKKTIPKKRLFVSDFFFETKAALPRAIVKRLGKDVTITVFGEYSNHCVSQWGKCVYNQVKKGRKVKYIELLESSVSANSSASKEINSRFLFGHERRVKREKEKKQKLKARKSFVK